MAFYGEFFLRVVADRQVCLEIDVESYIQYRERRGQGPLKIRAELRERGIDDTAIDGILEVYADQWRELAGQVREKKFGASLPVDFRERSRQMRFLQQRGFTAEQISGLFRDCD